MLLVLLPLAVLYVVASNVDGAHEPFVALVESYCAFAVWWLGLGERVFSFSFSPRVQARVCKRAKHTLVAVRLTASRTAGILSSIGLGTGMHTGLLFLFPHILKVSVAATECGNVDFDSMSDMWFMTCVARPRSLVDDTNRSLSRRRDDAFVCKNPSSFGHAHFGDILYRLCRGGGRRAWSFVWLD